MRCPRCHKHRIRNRGSDKVRYCIGCGWEVRISPEVLPKASEASPIALEAPIKVQEGVDSIHKQIGAIKASGAISAPIDIQKVKEMPKEGFLKSLFRKIK